MVYQPGQNNAFHPLPGLQLRAARTEFMSTRTDHSLTTPWVRFKQLSKKFNFLCSNLLQSGILGEIS